MTEEFNSSGPEPEESSDSVPEKRRNLRIPLRILKVETELHGDVFFGHARNISTSGLFIETTNPKEIGLKVKIRFELPRTKEKIACDAEVMWIQEFTGKKNEAPGMGLKFVELSPETSLILGKFLEEKTAT